MKHFAAFCFPVLCVAFSPSPATFAVQSHSLRSGLCVQSRLPLSLRKFVSPVKRLSGGSSPVMSSSASSTVEKPIYVQSGYRRPLHWVFKIGSLEKSLDFYEKVFGMHVHRHEEFASGCEATCNGPYGGAWSKTMVGYAGEDTNFALELTYNYGIDSYAPGADLRHIALRSTALRTPDPSAVGPYPVSTDPATGLRTVTGPDGYRFLLVDAPAAGAAAAEPFLFVSLRVKDLDRSLAFYKGVLGFRVFDGVPGTLAAAGAAGPRSAVVGFSDAGTKLELVEEGRDIDHGLAGGRFATETEDGVPFAMAERVRDAGAGRILHGPIKLQPHNEEVVIVEDADGYEFCFVDARGYNNCISVAYKAGGTSVDWAFRARLEAASKAPKNAKLEVAKVLAGNYDAAAVRAKIEDRIKQNPVVVFSQTSCPFCAKAKGALKEAGARHEVVEVDKLGDEGYAWRVELAALTGSGTVPQVFIGGRYVGGFSDGLEPLAKDGSLEPLLRSAGAL